MDLLGRLAFHTRRTPFHFDGVLNACGLARPHLQISDQEVCISCSRNPESIGARRDLAENKGTLFVGKRFTDDSILFLQRQHDVSTRYREEVR